MRTPYPPGKSANRKKSEKGSKSRGRKRPGEGEVTKVLLSSLPNLGEVGL